MKLSVRSISLAEWCMLKCGDTITDHDGKVWDVVYVGRGTRHVINVAPHGARSGSEVCISRNDDGTLALLYGEGAQALMWPTRRTRSTPQGIAAA
jgi:hypothetical protein